MSGNVFVSYSQPDRECAFEMVAQLEAQSIRCWIAPRDITSASDWAAEIIDAISAARAMVLVLSASSNDSPQVRREVERAVHKQLIILPLRIEDVRPSKSPRIFPGHAALDGRISAAARAILRAAVFLSEDPRGPVARRVARG